MDNLETPKSTDSLFTKGIRSDVSSSFHPEPIPYGIGRTTNPLFDSFGEKKIKYKKPFWKKGKLRFK